MRNATAPTAKNLVDVLIKTGVVLIQTAEL